MRLRESFHTLDMAFQKQFGKDKATDAFQTSASESARRSKEAADKISASPVLLASRILLAFPEVERREQTRGTSHCSAVQRIAGAVMVAASDNRNQIDQSPDATASKCKKLDNTDDRMTSIETMDPDHTQEDTKQQCR